MERRGAKKDNLENPHNPHAHTHAHTTETNTHTHTHTYTHTHTQREREMYALRFQKERDTNLVANC